NWAMYASTSARRASASIRRAPSRTSSSITDDAADRAAPEPSRSAESETTVSIGSYLPDQRCRAGLAWNLSSVTREGTPHPKPIHRFQALLPNSEPHLTGKGSRSGRVKSSFRGVQTYRMSGTFLVVTLGPFHRAEPAPLVKTLRAQIRLEGPEPQALRANALCQPDQFATDATPGQRRFDVEHGRSLSRCSE